MGTLRQSQGERQRLREIWEAHPTVKQLRADVEEFAVTEGLKFDRAGMDAVNRFTSAWLAECEDWPDSGILIG